MNVSTTTIVNIWPDELTEAFLNWIETEVTPVWKDAQDEDLPQHIYGVEDIKDQLPSIGEPSKEIIAELVQIQAACEFNDTGYFRIQF